MLFLIFFQILWNYYKKPLLCVYLFSFQFDINYLFLFKQIVWICEYLDAYVFILFFSTLKRLSFPWTNNSCINLGCLCCSIVRSIYWIELRIFTTKTKYCFISPTNAPSLVRPPPSLFIKISPLYVSFKNIIFSNIYIYIYSYKLYTNYLFIKKILIAKFLLMV